MQMEVAVEEPTSTRVEEAGPLTHVNHDSLETSHPSHLSPSQNPDMEETAEHASSIQQPLESHEVMELQAFSERKEWIMDKIKVRLPPSPTTIYCCPRRLTISRAKAPGGHASHRAFRRPRRRACLDCRGLRAAYQETARRVARRARQDREGNGDIRLRRAQEVQELHHGSVPILPVLLFLRLTRGRTTDAAASKRNLSPQDTDIIELTLTTIYEFDKLLHLLRDRSDNLESLSVRLTWEEQRCAAWADRRQLLLDLQSFLLQRARWSPSVYDALPQVEGPVPAPTPTPAPTLSRRGSATSLASEYSNSFPSGFSRGARFRHAEALSREAAQFAGRISSLRHGKIAAAGKALDTLIERKRVPDELLDEQDKLEEQGIREMENVGRFIMSVVTQWRKYSRFSHFTERILIIS
jgi:hypothetical protein